MRSSQQKAGEPPEIILQRLFVERHSRQAQKIIFEIIQVPGDRLAIEAGARIAHLVVQIAPGFNLKTRQYSHRLAVCLHRLRVDVVAASMGVQKIKQRDVAQVLLEIGALFQLLGINLRNRQSLPPEIPGELKKCAILLVDCMRYANGAHASARQTHNNAARTAKLPLQRLHLFGRKSVVLFKQPFQYVHEIYVRAVLPLLAQR